MKKSLLALAALTAFAGVASAQSSVTMFGIVDLSARQVKNSVGTVQGMATDGNASSRWGVRGIEDLGGGLKASFHLEAGLAADVGTAGGNNGCTTRANTAVTANTGTIAANPAYNNLECPNTGASVLFNRRANLSLLGGFGEIRMGREYTPSFWNHTVYDPFGTNGIGSTLNVSSGLGAPATTFVRANNTISYLTPAMGGFFAQVMVAAGETVTGNKYSGFRAGYAAGPVSFALASGTTAQTNLMTSTFKDTNFGGTYDLGAVKLWVQSGKWSYAAESQKTMMLGLTAPVGSGTVKFAYTKNTGSTANATLTSQYNAKQMALGYVYDLSPRTALYTHYSKISNSGGTANGSNFQVGGPNGGATARGSGVTGMEFGVRHSF